MVRRSAFLALVALTLATPAAAAPIRGQTLMPGVIYSKQVQFTAHGPVVLNVVSAPRPTGLYGVRAALSNGALPGREKLVDMENELSASTTVVGINGDLFDSRWGTPSGLLMRGGVVTAASRGGRSAVGFDDAGMLRVDKVTVAATWKGTGQFRPMGFNEPPGKSNVTLYTPAWGATTPGELGAVEEITLAPLAATRPNETLTAPAVAESQSGSQPIPPNGAVLVARKTQVPVLSAEVKVGAPVSVRLVLSPRWTDVREAVGGGPEIVRNGKPVFRSNETFTTSQLFTRTARSAIGTTADGRLLLVTVDGGRPGYSLGVTNFELALAMMRLGARDASALGTGGSAALAYDGKLLSRPSGDASVADALFITYDGVVVPTPTLNGGNAALAYKVVRRSHVTATLTAPDGSTTTLDDAVHDAGTYTLQRPSLSSGAWKFSVTSVDDLGRRTNAERAFSVGQ
jgi:Phosphodiester glycosidase